MANLMTAVAMGGPIADRHHAPRRLLRPSRRVRGPAERRGERAGVHRPDDGRRAASDRSPDRPSRAAGAWTPGLVDLILHDLEDAPGALPLLSHALLETWHRRRGRTLTVEGYARGGRRPKGDRAHGRPAVRAGAGRRRAGDRPPPAAAPHGAGRRHRRYAPPRRPAGADPDPRRPRRPLQRPGCSTDSRRHGS